jgi:hypothetical protein
MPDEIQKWVALAGAVIAAIASGVNLWWTHGAKVDKIKVNFGSSQPPISPAYSLYVVSQSDHKIVLVDYGFINASGALLSVPQLHVDEPDFGGAGLEGLGSSTLETRGVIFEPGAVELRDSQIGAYARTASGHRSYGFDFGVAWYKKLWLKFRLWRKLDFQ